MSISRPSTRLRGIAASFGALTLAGTLAISGVVGEGAEMTEAAWSDTEAATAQIDATWMQGFTRVTQPGWKRQGTGLGGPSEVTKNFGLTYPQIPGYFEATGTDSNQASFGDNFVPNIVPARNTTDDLWMGRYTTASLNTDNARAAHCMSFPSPTSITGSTKNCFASTNPAPRIVAHHNNLGFTFSIESTSLKIARVNASGFASTAQCFADGTSSASIAHGDDSVLQLANEWAAGNAGFNREADIRGIIPTSDTPDVRHDGTTNTWGRYHPYGTSGNNSSFVLAVNVRKDTYTAPYYALAEMELIVQVYSSGASVTNPVSFRDQINIPLTRSECGFSDGTQPLPPMAGTWRGDDNQMNWPGRSLGNVVDPGDGRFTTFEFEELGIQSEWPDHVTMRGIQEDNAIAAELSPAITTTSPLQSATASETTTSAPPSPPEEEDAASSAITTSQTGTSTARTTISTQAPTTSTSAATAPPATRTTTTTSAAPVIVVPGEPGDLAATAQTEDAGTVEVDGEKLVVVVEGDTVPSDARTAPAALDTWINDRRQPSGDWTTFTSTDPDENGWRWAAINQETGTIVYVR